MVAAQRRQVWDNPFWLSEQQFSLDLHLMSVGAAQAMIHVWLLDLRALLWEGRDLPHVLRYIISCNLLEGSWHVTSNQRRSGA